FAPPCGEDAGRSGYTDDSAPGGQSDFLGSSASLRGRRAEPIEVFFDLFQATPAETLAQDLVLSPSRRPEAPDPGAGSIELLEKIVGARGVQVDDAAGEIRTVEQVRAGPETSEAGDGVLPSNLLR